MFYFDRSTNRDNGQFGRKAFRHEVETRLIPSLRAFEPDLIILSAGFDGGKHDLGNCMVDLRCNEVSCTTTKKATITREKRM